MSKSRLAGGILLIAGTTIGGGILALPVALSEAGFVPSVLLLLCCWLAMTMAALLLLEVTLWFPRNSHLISMAGKTLGPWGIMLAWVGYLLLLYSLVSAYISGGTDLLQGLLTPIHLNPGPHTASIVFTLLLGWVVWKGIRTVDLVNRGLMTVKLGAFLLLSLLLLWHVDPPRFAERGPLHSGSIMVAITSFGFSVMIPSLRNYFRDDITQLKRAIWIGSGIPLAAYLLWIAAVMGVIPRMGADGLIDMLHNGRPVTGMVEQISQLLAQPVVTGVARLFTSVCLLTSFLGVTLCLVDFWADGFKVEKIGIANTAASLAAMLPPLLLVLFRPDVFVLLLGYAGVMVVLLLVVLPVLMTWRGRYSLKLAGQSRYTVAGGKSLLILLLGLSFIMITLGILNLSGHSLV